MTKIISLDEKPVLDLRYTAFEHLHGSILVVGSWYMDPDTRQSQPAMVLLDATGVFRKRRMVPCIIPLSEMWKWTLEMGDPKHVGAQIHDWLKSGALPGNPNNKRDCWNVMNAVQSRLRDIVAMPPLPVKAVIKHGAIPVGTMTVTERDTGKTVDEIEVTASHGRD